MRSLAIVLAVAYVSTLAAIAEPPSSDQVLAEAKAKASAEHKTIFLHFGASLARSGVGL